MDRMENEMTLIERIQSNMQVHGAFWAARRYKEECRRAHKVDNFDVFYFALFGRWPARKSQK